MSRKVTSRFIAGRALPDGIGVLKQLSKEQMLGTLDFLGENVKSLEEAVQSKNAYLHALDAIDAARLPATVSIKLTQFGLDFSEQACCDNVIALVQRANAMNSRIEVDMESSEYTDRTLQMVLQLQDRFRGNVRAVIQAYLYRSEADIRMLSERKVPVRLCKGAYNEPPAVAFPKKADVDANYVKLMKLLLEEGTYPAIASHDENIVTEAVHHIQKQKIPSDRFEFQMLYGIRRDLQRKLVAQNYRLRLYVPYGDAWYPYFMRRLAERPANVLFLAKNLIRS
ncbi:MAG: proline dehydrogenase family protein [Acidobacteriaceae bacterium]|nr:proline dehydrogenase family protein [Acidobacteriaceae bacterium]MBV9297094.1 proline dehydrogenase family protein [Acidobacteriaceae bacterium]MBV9763752.1 proline dehydrogenase family protein [Acidobacteriaceae bacterium]